MPNRESPLCNGGGMGGVVMAAVMMMRGEVRWRGRRKVEGR